jgi:O-antigen ligase
MPFFVKLFLSTEVFLILMIFLIIGLISKPERGWILYVILLSLLPFLWYAASPLLQRTGHFLPYARAFLPIVVLTILIFVIWLCNQIAMRKEISFQKGPLFYPFLVFIAANLLSLINAEDVQSGLIIILAWAFVFLLYLTIYNTMDKFSHIETFANFFITACTVLSIYGLYLWLSGVPGKGANPFAIVGMLESNHFAFIAAEAMFLSMLLSVFSHQKLSSRIFYPITFLLLFLTLIFTFSRGVWVSCAMVFLWLACVKSVISGRERNLGLAGYAFISLFIGFLIFYIHPDVHARFLTIFKGSEASLSRYEMDKAAWYAFLEHPFLGVGVNNFVLSKHVLGREMAGTANLYSRMLAETGIIGFVAFILVMIRIYRVLSQGVRTAVPRSKEQLIQLGFLAGFLANAIDFLFFGLIYPLPWIFFSIGIASTKVFPER